MIQPVEVEIETPSAIQVEVTVPGPQGPDAVNNVIVSTTEPTNKFINLIWINPSP